jgi:GAF domain-containing protein
MTIGWEHEDGSFRASLDELTALLVAEERLETVLHRVVELACSGIGACDVASVTDMTRVEPETIVSSDAIAVQIDQVQYEHDSGPCLYASRRREAVSVPSMSDGDSWQPFRDAAIGRGVHSSFSLPLAAGEVNLGALNLYSRQEHGFNSVPPDAALVFAAQAAAAVWNARTHERTREMVTGLEQALESRDVIGVAKGVIMANEKMTQDEAFKILIAASQNRNVKIRDLAVEVAETGTTPN